MDLPPPLLDRARRARRVAEVAAGARFDVALALARVARANVLVTDRDPAVLRAPAPLVAAVDDLLAPDLALYDGVDLVVAVRIPEELQAPAARLASRLGADLALRPLKDEWADLRPWTHETLP
ncbi:MAG TPA: UPF0146 family protein, partial [Candidatus Thermoplasmatota archaeon]|nr:UPF0146 family protein [Candidatus Thermoplasmatota archaeon]